MLEDFVVLGANSALPLIDRFSSSFVVRARNRYFMIDAGEGCQIKLGQFKIKRSKISHILISHLHGDHIFGLPGLINSFNLNGRKEPLIVYGPAGIKEYLNTILRISNSHLSYEMTINEITHDGFHTLFEVDGLRVSAFPLKHRVPTFGYRINELNVERNILSAKISEYNLTVDEIKLAKLGKSIKRDKLEIPNEEVTHFKRNKKSFAYCSDTVYDELIVAYISKVSILYHEATYLEELRKQAEERMHTTALGAAQIASLSEAEHLIIGHFSSRYTELTPLLEEACSEFNNTSLATEGASFSF